MADGFVHRNCLFQPNGGNISTSLRKIMQKLLEAIAAKRIGSTGCVPAVSFRHRWIDGRVFRHASPVPGYSRNRLRRIGAWWTFTTSMTETEGRRRKP